VLDPNDKWTFFVNVLIQGLFSRLVPGAYQCMQNVARVFKGEADGLEWTLFRIASIPGKADADSWKKGREHSTYVGYVGDKDWTYWTNRSGLARWLVDMVEQGQGDWIGKVPAVSNLAVARQ
jgi:hypothetical protein